MKNAKTGTPTGTPEPTATPTSGNTPPDLSKVDPFDPAMYRVTAVAASLGVKKALTHITVGKPPAATFVRAHPDPEYTEAIAVFEDAERDLYMVPGPMLPFFPGKVRQITVTLAQDRQGNLFLWKVAGEDGDRRRVNTWTESMTQALRLARRGWVRVESNMAAKGYDVFVATAPIPDPAWPDDRTMSDYLRLAFGTNGVITSMEHPAVKALQGL